VVNSWLTLIYKAQGRKKQALPRLGDSELTAGLILFSLPYRGACSVDILEFVVVDVMLEIRISLRS
jgi:hypothetical protein